MYNELEKSNWKIDWIPLIFMSNSLTCDDGVESAKWEKFIEINVDFSCFSDSVLYYQLCIFFFWRKENELNYHKLSLFYVSIIISKLHPSADGIVNKLWLYISFMFAYLGRGWIYNGNLYRVDDNLSIVKIPRKLQLAEKSKRVKGRKRTYISIGIN